MTNEEIKQALWEAYKEGLKDQWEESNATWFKADFDDWLTARYPELSGPPPSFDGTCEHFLMT